MFERFTDRARRCVVLAQEEARMLNHNYIGTEHILLGLIHEGDGVAAKAMEALNISLEAVRSQVEEIIGQGQAAPTGHIPFTPRAKKVLELSLREALQLGHSYLGTEHILLGLIREGEGVAAQVLQKLGADLNRVRKKVIELLEGSAGEGGGPPGEGSQLLLGDVADRGKRALDLGEELTRGLGDPSVTSTAILIGLLMNEPRLQALEDLVKDLRRVKEERGKEGGAEGEGGAGKGKDEGGIER